MADDVRSASPARRLDDLTAVSVRDMVLDHDRKLDAILVRFAKFDGAMGLMKVAFGASILSALVSILAVVQMMAGAQ